MKTRKYFMSYNFKLTNGGCGWGETIQIANGTKLKHNNLEECRKVIKEVIEEETGTEVKNVVFMFIKDVTNGF